MNLKNVTSVGVVVVVVVIGYSYYQSEVPVTQEASKPVAEVITKEGTGKNLGAAQDMVLEIQTESPPMLSVDAQDKSTE